MTTNGCVVARRRLLALAGGLAGTLMLPGHRVHAGATSIEVFKTPACGCCSLWVEHLESSGYRIVAQDMADLTQVKRLAGVPPALEACHTALVEGYTIEGHVPAAAIGRLLRERPAVRGLAVPGMPAGSPGMPASDPERYHVFAFGAGEPGIFATFVGTDRVG